MTTNQNSTQHESMIAGLTVRSSWPVIVYGSVRGLVAEAESAEGAFEALAADREGCQSQGGYSDARVYCWQGEDGWVGFVDPREGA